MIPIKRIIFLLILPGLSYSHNYIETLYSYVPAYDNDSNQIWHFYSNEHYIYNSINLVTQKVKRLYVDNTWTDNSKSVFLYDNNRLVQEIKYLPGEVRPTYVDNLWHNYTKKTLTYSSDYEIAEKVIYIWVDMQNAWVIQKSATIDFDVDIYFSDHGQFFSYQMEWHNGHYGAIRLHCHYEKYMEDSIMESGTFYWNFDSLAWENGIKYEYNYGDNNKLTSTYLYVYEEQSGWEENRRFFYKYDTGGKLTSYEYFIWDIVLHEWSLYKYEKYINYERDGVENKITIDCNKTTLECDDSLYLESTVWETDIKKHYYKYDWNSTTKNWDYNTKITYIYYNDDQVIPINEASILLFPNPAINNVRIDLGIHSLVQCTFTLYNIMGKILLSNLGPFTDNYDLNIEYLTPGIYFLEIQDDSGNIYKRKFLKA